MIWNRRTAPVLPLSMLRSRTVVFGSLIGFAANVAMFSVLVYLPAYLHVVHGVSATLSGVHLLPLVVSQSLAGRWAARPARVGAILIAGTVLNVAPWRARILSETPSTPQPA